MSKSKRVMQVEHLGESMWLYDNGDIRNSKGHLKGKGEVPQSYTDGLQKLEVVEEMKESAAREAEKSATVETALPWRDEFKELDNELLAKVAEVEAELPKPPPAPPEIKEPPMNDLQLVVNIGRKTPDGFEVSFSKSKVIGSHNIKVISGKLRHKLQGALERIVLQSNDDLRAIRDAPLVEKYKEWAEEDAKKASHKKELKDLLKGL